MKLVLLILLAFGSIFAFFVYWAMKPVETAFLSTANVSDNIAQYYHYTQVVEFWPVAGWFFLLIFIGFVAFKIIRSDV
jgi:hypothetical protein